MKNQRAKHVAAVLFVLVLAAVAAVAAGAEGAGPAPRRFLLLIDLRQNDLAGVAMSKTAALYFLDNEVRNGDEAAFLTFSELQGLKVREEFTADLARLRKSVDSLTQNIGLPDEDSWSTGLRTHSFLEEMGDFAEGLDDVPGTKNMIYFTSGFPVYEYQGDRTFRDLYDQMSRRFKEAQAPVFVVNALGVRADWLEIEARPDFVLRKLAEVSGGRYFRDVAQYKSIAQEIGKLAIR